MSPSARREYVRRMQLLYRGANGRKKKSRILQQVSETLACHPKHAGRLMRGKVPGEDAPLRHRKPVYPERLIRVLEGVWEAMQFAWSVRLKAGLPLWMSWIKSRWELTRREEQQLLMMSPATMDRRLARYKKRLGSKIYGKTKPGRWLRQSIPIQTDSSKVPEPGWMEADTVSHSGPNAAGLFAHTLDFVDLFSGWVEMRATLGKEAVTIVAASDEVRQELPFELKGMDTDNGDEFINYELDRYCRKRGIRQFRSRPYKKDDQAHIEQKNGTHVRRLIGWDRYDTIEAVIAMNDLYRHEWRLLANLFLPSVKLANKIRIGSKIKRVYEDAKTPLDRLLESDFGDRARLERFRRLRSSLDPFALSQAVERKLQRVWKLASRGRIKAAPPPYIPVQIRWEDRFREDDIPAFHAPKGSNGFERLSKIAWRNNYFGTN